MIVVVGGIKGGSGKTTIATNLAVIRAMDARKVLLVDADEQKSATDWAAQRASQEQNQLMTTIQLSGKGVYAQIKRMQQDYDDVIIDVGGRDTTSQRSALTVADVLVVPFKPRSLDIWTLGSLKTMINEIKSVNHFLDCIAVINQADSRGTDNEEVMEVLKECTEIKCIENSIGHRKSFGNAASDGLSVIEMKEKDKKAVEEILKLYDYIYNTKFQSITPAVNTQETSR